MTLSTFDICVGDAHIPFESKPVFKMVVNFIRDHPPQRLHLLGDLLDGYSISRFDKDPVRKDNLQDELDSVRQRLTELRDAAPKATLIYSEGNHEYRLRRYLMSEAKALAGLRSLALEKLLDFDKLKIRFQPADRPYRVGQLLFTHGNLVSKWSGASAKRHYEKYGCCVIHGHSHRLGAFYHTDINTTYGAWENGCLCSLTPDYVTAPDWQHGFSVVHYAKHFFHVEQIAITNGQFCYAGQVVGRRMTAAPIIDTL